MQQRGNKLIANFSRSLITKLDVQVYTLNFLYGNKNVNLNSLLPNFPEKSEMGSAIFVPLVSQKVQQNFLEMFNLCDIDYYFTIPLWIHNFLI
jgi:hypothetical protein